MSKHFHNHTPTEVNHASNELTLNIIGCGKVGKTLGALFVKTNHVKIRGIVNSTMNSANEAALFITQGSAYAAIDLLPPADIYLIATPDDMLVEIVNKWTISPSINHAAIIVHCSGAHSSQLLAPIKQLGYSTASIHPLKSFADPEQTMANFAGTLCTIEGDAIALSVITPLLEKMKAQIFSITSEQKILCHTASVLANNYLTTLHYHAMQCYQHAGFDEEIAKKATTSLMQNALANLDHLPHHLALTGPIQRADLNTIKKHQAALQALNMTENKLLAELYNVLGLNTLIFAHLSKEKKQKITELLISSK